MKLNRITISGLAGSGKTTIGKLVANKLDYDFVSIGNFSREFAQQKFNLNINEFQEYCNQHPEVDTKIDVEFSDDCNSRTQIVVDYRLGYKFIRNSFNIFLEVSEEEAVSRLVRANRQSEFTENSRELIRKTITKRNEDMFNRFLLLYNTNFTDKRNYNLVINTDKYQDFDDIVDIIIHQINLLDHAVV